MYAVQMKGANPSDAEATFVLSIRTQIFENRYNAVMFVFIVKLPLSTQNEFPLFIWFLHHFVLAKLATSSIRVKQEMLSF